MNQCPSHQYLQYQTQRVLLLRPRESSRFDENPALSIDQDPEIDDWKLIKIYDSIPLTR